MILSPSKQQAESKALNKLVEFSRNKKKWRVRSGGYLEVEASYGRERKEMLSKEKFIHLVPSTIVTKLAMLSLKTTKLN